MSPDEFFSLPPAIALRVLFDALDEETSASLLARAKPEQPRRAKYDAQIHGSRGYQWASETDLRGLRWWHKRAVESSQREGNQYADRDKKQAANLAKWIAWREWYPDAVWSGTRGDDEVVAAPPSAKPFIHQRAQNGQRRQQQPRQLEDDSFDPDTF